MFEQLLHNGIHDSHTVSADTVEHLVDSNSLDLLGLRRAFDEDLSMEVVVIVLDVDFRLSKQHQNVYTLVKLLSRQVRGHDANSILITG